MFNVINLAERRLAACEQRNFDLCAADIRAGVEVRANIEELEALVMYTDQPQLRAAIDYLLAQYAGLRAS